MSALMVLIGVVLVCVAYGYDTTVPNEYIGGGTHNLGELQTQMMLLHTGLASIVVGAILSLKTPAAARGVTLAATPAVELTPEEQAEKAERLREAQRLNHKILAVVLALPLLVGGLFYLFG